jgi:hypothetical protein
MTVFLSYAHQDAATVKLLARELEGLAGAVWFDESVTGGQLWWDEILSQIRSCHLFVLAVSRHSLSSPACGAEWSYAASLARAVLAVRIDTVDLVSAPPSIRHTQLINFVANDAESVRALARAVIHTPQVGPLPDILPTPPPVPESYRDRFAALFGPELTMADQVNAFARLKLDIDKDVNADEARGLLRVLHDRADASWKVREDIDRFLGESRPSSTTAPGVGPVVPEPPVQLPVAGWYDDPTRRFELRYWNGKLWTEHVCRGGQTFGDPMSRP